MNVETYGQINFNLPHDVVPLPTQGIFYKTKKKTVKVGYLTANDENLLISSNQNNMIISLLRNKIYEHDLRPEELLEQDIESILIFLRNTSFGPEYTVNLIDPKTNKEFTTNILLDELNINQPNNSPNEDGLFVTHLPKSDVSIKLRPLTYGESIEIDKMLEQYPVGRTPPRITMRLTRMIEEVNGDTDKGSIAMFVENLPIMDSKYIRNFLKENIPSLDLKRFVTAPSGERVTFDVTFGADFFRPFF